MWGRFEWMTCKNLTIFAVTCAHPRLGARLRAWAGFGSMFMFAVMARLSGDSLASCAGVLATINTIGGA